MIYLDVVLTLVLIAIVVLIRAVRKTQPIQEELIKEVRSLRLTSRARIGQASISSGPRPREQALKRLGRASVGKRIVVGGEEDSELNQRLTTRAAEVAEETNDD